VKDVRVNKSKVVVGFKGIVTDTDQSVLDMAYAKQAYNFVIEDGVLTGGIGIDPAQGFYVAPYVERHPYPELPAGKRLRDVFLYRRKNADGTYADKLIAHLTNAKFMYTAAYETDEWHDLSGLMINEDVTAVNYNYNGEDVLLLGAKNAKLHMIKDTTPLILGDSPQFTSIEVHNERVFGCMNGVQNQIWFSDDFNPQNWSVSETEAGFINFADECGEVLELVSFLNYLYVFREFGIFRLTAYGEQNEFMLKKVFTDTGRIVKNSIEVCGDKIIFYATNGLFTFDGYEVTRIAKQLPPIERTHLMSCAYIDDYYYMACKIEGSGTKNNAVIRYGLKDKTLCILYGYSVKRLRPIKIHNGSQVLCVFESKNQGALGMMSRSGEVMGEVTAKSYISPESALSSSSLKTVRSVTLQTDSDIMLTVKLDGKAYEYAVKGSDLLKTVPVERSGRKIGFEISCAAKHAYVTPLIVSVDTLAI